jgi:tetratricopeptide (TPR) repeat protein
MLDCQLFGLNPSGHHVVNLLFHAANTILLFLLLKQMTGALWRSAIVAALFAVHPLHVESVAWIAERKDLLSTFFFILSLWAYACYTRAPDWKKYTSVILLFAMGLLSKPMLVTLPFVLLLLDYWPLNRLEQSDVGKTSKIVSVRKLIIEKIPFLFLSILSCIVTFSAQSKNIRSLLEVPFLSRLANAPIAYVKYLALTFFPLNLAVIYPFPEYIGIGEVLFALAVITLISVLVFRVRKGRIYLPVGWLWFLGTLVPVIGIVQVGQQALADRYTYIPLIGLFIILVWGGNELREDFKISPRTAGLVASGLILFLALLSVHQVACWANTFTLFNHTLTTTTRNYIAHNNLGFAFMEMRKWDSAREHLDEALRINPNYAKAQHNLALLFHRQGKLSEAIFHYQELLRVHPFPDARYSYATALLENGQVYEAEKQLALILKDDSGNAAVYNLYGILFLKKDDKKSAIACFTKALQIDPHDNNARRNLSLLMGDNLGKK